MSTYTEEQNAKTVSRDIATRNIFESIKNSVEKNGFNIEYVANTFSEMDNKYKIPDEIIITYPGLKYFKATIYPLNAYNTPNKHKLFVETSTSIKERSYNDNEYNKSISFANHLSHEQAKALGLISDYSVCLYSINKEFKSDKNTKLILNDILPALDKYLAAMMIIEPSIDKYITQHEQILQLQNAVAIACNTWTSGELKERSYTLPDNKGRLSISEYGTITHTKELTPAQLKALLNLKD